MISKPKMEEWCAYKSIVVAKIKNMCHRNDCDDDDDDDVIVVMIMLMTICDVGQ